MSLHVPYKKCKNKDEAFKKASGLVTPAYLAKFGIEAKLKIDDKKKVIVAAGTGFTLTMKFEDEQTSTDVDLALLLRPLKGKIEKTLDEQLKKVL